MINYMKVLTLYRNVCAHSERLFSYRTAIDISDTVVHNKLNITRNGSQYSKGKKDLFSVVIIFRYLLPKADFNVFKRQLIQLLNSYQKKNQLISTSILYEYMGFPENWKEITKFHKI